jgi:hypothetical protein
MTIVSMVNNASKQAAVPELKITPRAKSNSKPPTT